MNTKNQSYQERIQEKIGILQSEIDELSAALKVINELDKKLGNTLIPFPTPVWSDDASNLGVLKGIIKEGEKQTPPVYYSSGELIKKFTEKKGVVLKSAQGIVYNTLSKAGKGGDLINDNGKWKSPV